MKIMVTLALVLFKHHIIHQQQQQQQVLLNKRNWNSAIKKKAISIRLTINIHYCKREDLVDKRIVHKFNYWRPRGLCAPIRSLRAAGEDEIKGIGSRWQRNGGQRDRLSVGEGEEISLFYKWWPRRMARQSKGFGHFGQRRNEIQSSRLCLAEYYFLEFICLRFLCFSDKSWG